MMHSCDSRNLLVNADARSIIGNNHNDDDLHSVGYIPQSEL